MRSVAIFALTLVGAVLVLAFAISAAGGVGRYELGIIALVAVAIAFAATARSRRARSL
jgi:hypothetical protein